MELNCSTRFVSLDGCFLSGAEAVSLKLPSKSEALAHLDRGESPPPRMAQAILVRGDVAKKFVGIYDVGPLDGAGGLGSHASVTLAKTVDWNRRPLDLSDSSMAPTIAETVKKLHELLTYSFGPVWVQLPGCQPERSGQLLVMAGANVFSSPQHRSARVWFNWFKAAGEFQVNWEHTLPFAFDVLQMGPPEQWRAENVSFCGQLFTTAEDLLRADRSNKVWRCRVVELTNYTWDVAGPDPGTKPRDASEDLARPPVAKTWRLTPGGSLIWGDWQLLVTLRPGTGLALHDVRFLGNRVAYELSLSDAQACYSSARPEKQWQFSDKAFSMIQLSGDMVEGLDCPPGAEFLDAATWVTFNPDTSFVYDPALAKPMKLACVFESPGYQGTSWRHTQLLNKMVTGRRNRQLVIRAVGTVGNYDYITEVRLGEDGHINVAEDFAGYPEMERSVSRGKDSGAKGGASAGRALDAKALPDWGSVVQANHRPDLAGDNVQNLHAHFVLFKVDLDVMGLENEFLVTRPTVAREAGAPPRKVQVTSRVEREDSAMTFVANPREPRLWRIVNPKAINPRTGTPMGYAIQMGSAPAVQTLPEDHPFTRGASFAKRHLAVTVRKEEEPQGVHSFDYFAGPDPLYSIDAFLADEESLVGRDLVCWVSMGKEHVGRTEDQPLISNFGVSFSIAPWDVHPENPQMQLSMVGPGPEEVLRGAAR